MFDMPLVLCEIDKLLPNNPFITFALYSAVDDPQTGPYSRNLKDRTWNELPSLAEYIITECAPEFLHLLKELWRLRTEQPEWTKFKEAVLTIPIPRRVSPNRNLCPVHGVDRGTPLGYETILRNTLLDKMDPVTIMNWAPTIRYYSGKARELVKCETGA